MSVPVIVLYFVGAISPDNPVMQTALAALQAAAPVAPQLQGLPVYIESHGGFITLAMQIAEQLAPFAPVCYVREAQSAALQIIMPACARVVMLAGTDKRARSVLGFHTAASCVGPEYVDATEALYLLRRSLVAAKRMDAGFAKAFGKTRCEVRGVGAPAQRFPETAALSCALQHMVARTTVGGPEFAAMHPYSTVRLRLVPEANFPAQQRKEIPPASAAECAP